MVCVPEENFAEPSALLSIEVERESSLSELEPVLPSIRVMRAQDIQKSCQGIYESVRPRKPITLSNEISQGTDG